MKLVEKIFLAVTVPVIVVLGAMAVEMGSMPYVIPILDKIL